jgi:hypothetical protein
MAADQKVLVLKASTRATIPREVPEREFWMTMRQSLLIQLSMIERKLGINRSCPHCGNGLRQNQG